MDEKKIWQSRKKFIFMRKFGTFLSPRCTRIKKRLFMLRLILFISLLYIPFSFAQNISSKTYEDVWSKYLQEVKADKNRLKEHQEKKIPYKDKVMKYEAKKVGKPDKTGYPLYIAMHGGGGAPARVNDSQWEHMKRYYLGSVKKGIYVAPRGVTNTWNLHFVNESYPLYDRLIENMIAFENVDPNQVYIMGFSAGGDGTYAISSRMADRWAAAAMSAGHHNGLDPRNLFNLPILLQVGDNDKAYKRHLVTVEFAEKLLKYQKAEKSGYVHQVNVHYRRGHNFLDNHPKEPNQKVISNPFEWKNGGKPKVKELNTNSVRWLSQYKRNPLPEKVIWNTKIKAPRKSANRHYWLGSDKDFTGEIIASYNKQTNKVTVEKAADNLVIFLNHSMLDLSKAVTFNVEGKDFSLKLKPNPKIMKETVRERGDKNYIFSAKVLLSKSNNEWVLKGQ